MKKRKFADGGIYTAEMGQPPQEPDMGSASPTRSRALMAAAAAAKRMPPKRPVPPAAAVKRPTPLDRRMDEMNGGGGTEPMLAGEKFAKGGKVGSASRRADGIAKQGKTRCKMV